MCPAAVCKLVFLICSLIGKPALQWTLTYCTYWKSLQPEALLALPIPARLAREQKKSKKMSALLAFPLPTFLQLLHPNHLEEVKNPEGSQATLHSNASSWKAQGTQQSWLGSSRELTKLLVFSLPGKLKSCFWMHGCSLHLFWWHEADIYRLQLWLLLATAYWEQEE